MSAISHTSVDLAGLTLNVAEAGSGPPLLLVHGWPEYSRVWYPVMERLSDRFRVIAPDLRGFGRSADALSAPNDQVGADRHADDMVSLLDALGIERAGFVGHDMGAYILQRVGIRHADRAEGLFFFNCPTHGVGARWRNTDHIPELWYQSFNQQPWAASLVGATRDSCRAFIGHFLAHWSHRKDAFDDVLEEWVDTFLRPGVLQGGFNWYISQNAGRLAVMSGQAPRPPKIAVRSGCLWGRHDPILKAEWSDVLGEYFDDIVVDFAEDEGHFVHFENPQLAANAIADFFGSER